MDRERRQLFLIAACATAIHAAGISTAIIYSGGARPYELPAVRWSRALPAPPVVPLAAVEPPDTMALGEPKGAGDAITAVDMPQRATSDRPEEINQPWTRQTPQPLPSRANASPEVQRASAAEAEQALGPMSVLARAPLTLPPLQETQPTAATDAAPQQRESSADEAQQAAKPQPEAPPPDSPSLAAAAEEPDPAEQGPSDLDPFATEEGVEFTRGGMKSRSGRKKQLARPRIDLGFMAEATQLSGDEISVRLLVETDETGHPKRVEVVGSSDSAIIDDAVRLAMFDSWFGGKMPDKFPFTVRFVRR